MSANFWLEEAREFVVANFWQGKVCRELVTWQKEAHKLVEAKLRPSGKVRETAEVGRPHRAFREMRKAAKD